MKSEQEQDAGADATGVSDDCAQLLILVWAVYNPEYNVSLFGKCTHILAELHHQERRRAMDVWMQAWEDWNQRGRPGKINSICSTKHRD